MPMTVSSASCGLLLALALPALARSGEIPAPGNAGVAAPLTRASPRSPLNLEDRMFLEQAAYAISAAYHAALFAEDAASDPNVKAYSRRIVSDNADAASDLAALASRKGAPLPNPCEQAGAAMNRLASDHGAAFDRAYMQAQLRDQTKALDLYEEAARSTGDSEVGAFANSALALARQRLDLARLIAGALDPPQAAR